MMLEHIRKWFDKRKRGKLEKIIDLFIYEIKDMIYASGVSSSDLSLNRLADQLRRLRYESKTDNILSKLIEVVGNYCINPNNVKFNSREAYIKLDYCQWAFSIIEKVINEYSESERDKLMKKLREYKKLFDESLPYQVYNIP